MPGSGEHQLRAGAAHDGRPRIPAGAAIELPPEAAPHLARLRRGLAEYRATAATPELSAAFTAAAGLIATVASRPADGRPNTDELRALAAAIPEFDEFLWLAAGEAGRVVRAAVGDLWARLGLRAAPPQWTPGELQAARMVFACACAPAQDPNPPARVQHGLRALAAGRTARALTAALADSEPAWEVALGAGYASLRHRCAPRTAWRSRGLSDLIAEDERSRLAVQARLENWLAAGGPPTALAGELEAALVHARTPSKFA
jgi:hypothetical protein